MHPIIFRIPGIGYDVPGYGLALMIGFLLSILWATRRALKSGGDPDVVLNCGFLALIGGVVGARFMYVYHYWEQFATRGNAFEIFKAVIDVRQGGLEVYGGFIAVCILVFGYLRFGGHSIRWYLDIMAPSAALGMAIGRIGCFLNGCCFGGVCDLPWAVRFPYGSPAAVQQWQDRVPGAELPDELIFVPETGMFSNGRAALPVPRELLTTPPETLDALKAWRQKLADVGNRLAATNDPAQQQALRAERAALERQARSLGGGRFGCACQPRPEVTVGQMIRYDLDAASLRALAEKHRSLPVHPTQPYSTITLGLLAALLSALYWRRTRDGQVIFTLLLLEPPTRWLIEIVRADNPVDTAGFTVSQFLALGLSLLGLVGLLWLRKFPPRSPRARIWEPPDEEPPQKPARKAKKPARA